MNGKQLDVFVFLLRVLLCKVPCRTAGGACIGHHEGQLKHLRAGKTTCRVARHRPYDVGHTVFGLVKQLGRGAAELHGGVNLAVQAVVGVLGDVVAPGFQHGGVLDGLWPQKVVHFQGDGLGLGGPDRAQQTSCEGGVFDRVFHGLSPLWEC